MRNLKKVAAGLMAGVMALGTMSGFAFASEYGYTDVPEIDWSQWATAADNGIELPELPGGVLKFEANIPDFNQSSEGTMIQQLWELAMEHYLGVDIEVTLNRTPWADYRTNELALLAADDIADVNSCGANGPALQQYGEDGMLVDLSEYTDYIHYYWDYVDGHPNGRNTIANEDGSMYYFMDSLLNETNVQGAQSFTGFAYRFDVLKENGLQPATTREEFTQLCADLQALIDNGTVSADYVMMNSTNGYAFYRGFVGMFHTWDTLYFNGTEWTYGPIEDNFREMLKYLNSLYEAGYIDPEFATATDAEDNEKASTGRTLVCPNLWAGAVNGWNAGTEEGSTIEWGLAYLPSDPEYGTAWKWGSRLPGKSLNTPYGSYICVDAENIEYLVALLDYQYSDEIVTLIDWGVEGVTFEYNEDGTKRFVDAIANAPQPATESANYGVSGSQVCRSGIPFITQDSDALIMTYGEDPWWNPEQGYYVGKYWVESHVNGGVDSVMPENAMQPVVRLTPTESANRSQLTSACENYAKEESLKFITGQNDINDDSAWESYIAGLKSQSDEDFDTVIQTMNEKTLVD